MRKNFLKTKVSMFLLFTCILSMFNNVQAYSDTETGNSNKTLKVVGSQLCDQNGEPIQLKGMSSHGIQWFGDYLNKDSIKWLKDDWGINVIRAAMYTDENGYISNKKVKEKVKETVEIAKELGLYVIIDWHILHDNNPNTYKEEAKEFFKEMATLYGEYPNVIYEICNEPNGNVNWDKDIKPYAEEVIPVIRSIDKDNVIIVGTGTWSQDIQDAAKNPLKYDNIMYALHFYAGTHGQELRDRISSAMNKDIAIFVSEWGTSQASGNGGVYKEETQEWINFLDNKKISWVNWSLCDKNETSAALNPGASKKGGWTTNQLSESGKLVRELIKSSSQNSTEEKPQPQNSTEEKPQPQNSTEEKPQPQNSTEVEPQPQNSTEVEPQPQNSTEVKPQPQTNSKKVDWKCGTLDSIKKLIHKMLRLNR